MANMDIFSEEENLIMLAESEDDGWAMVCLGNMYAERNEYDKAYEWYLKAEKTDTQNAYDATFNIANMYFYGRYFEQDYQMAYNKFLWLAERDYDTAIFYLGLYAEYGFLGKVDYRKAIEYYEKAIKLGNAYSATNLGRMYSLGVGVEIDTRKGFEYYKMAYEMGDVLACANVGYCYEVGQGVKKCKWKAIKYYYEGTKRGEENASENLHQFKKFEILPVIIVVNIMKKMVGNGRN